MRQLSFTGIATEMPLLLLVLISNNYMRAILVYVALKRKQKFSWHNSVGLENHTFFESAFLVLYSLGSRLENEFVLLVASASGFIHSIPPTSSFFMVTLCVTLLVTFSSRCGNFTLWPAGNAEAFLLNLTIRETHSIGLSLNKLSTILISLFREMSCSNL